MDLARMILLAIERRGEDEPAAIRFDDRCSETALSEHTRLLVEAGLIHALEARHGEGYSRWQPQSLTWAGHDFLDLIRSDAAWEHIKQIMKRTGGFNFALLTEVAMHEARKHVHHEVSYVSDRMHFASQT
jgi:hypothetical protein